MLQTAYKLVPGADLFKVAASLKSDIHDPLLEAVYTQTLADAVAEKDSDWKHEKTFTAHLSEAVVQGVYFSAFDTKVVFYKNHVADEVYILVYQSFGWQLIQNILESASYVENSYSYWNTKDQDYLTEDELAERKKRWEQVDMNEKFTVNIFPARQKTVTTLHTFVEVEPSLKYPSFDVRFRDMLFPVYCDFLEKNGRVLDFEEKLRAAAEFYVSNRETLSRLPYSERFPALVDESVDFCENYLAAHDRYKLEVV